MVEDPNDLTIIHPDHRIVAIAFHRHLGRGDIGKRQAVSTGAGPPIIVVIRNRVGSIPAAVCIAFEEQRSGDGARRFFVMHSTRRQPPQVIAYSIRKTDRLQRVIRITPRQRKMVEDPDNITIIHPDHRIVAIAFHRHLGRGDIGECQAIGAGTRPVIVIVIRDGERPVTAAVFVCLKDVCACRRAVSAFVIDGARGQTAQIVADTIRETYRFNGIIRVTTGQGELVHDPNDLTVVDADYGIIAVAFHRHFARGDIREGQRIGALTRTIIVIIIADAIGSITAIMHVILMRAGTIDGPTIGLGIRLQARVYGRRIPFGRIGKLDEFNPAIAAIVLVLQGDRPAGRQADDQLCAIARQGNLLRQGLAQQKAVRGIGGACIHDNVLAIVICDDIKVIAQSTLQQVVTVQTVQRVGIIRPNQCVIKGRRLPDAHSKQIGLRPTCAIGKADCLNALVRDIAQGDLIRGSCEGQDHLVALGRNAGDGNVLGQISIDFQNIRRTGGVQYHILAIATGEDERIVTCPALLVVVAQTTKDGLGQTPARDHVITVSALPIDIGLQQIGQLPFDPVGKADHWPACRLQDAFQKDLIAGFRRSEDQVRRIRPLAPHVDFLRHEIGQGNCGRNRGLDYPKGIQSIALTEHNLRICAHGDIVGPTARDNIVQCTAIAGINLVVIVIRTGLQELGTQIGIAQFRPIGKDEGFDPTARIVARAAQDSQNIALLAQTDDEITVQLFKAHIFTGHPVAEFNPVYPTIFGNRIATVAKPKAIGVTAKATAHFIGAGTAVQRIVPVVEPDQQVVLFGALHHSALQVIQSQNDAAGEMEFLHGILAQPALNGQHIRRIAQINDQVITTAPQNERLHVHRRAKDHPVDRTIADLGLLNNRVEIIPRTEGIGIGQMTTDQRVIALPPIQYVFLIQKSGDLVVAPVAADNLQQFLNIRDVPSCSVLEFEVFDAVRDIAELVANTQAILAILHRDQQVITILGEDDIGRGDIVTKDDPVGCLNLVSLTPLPDGALLRIFDHVSAIADVEPIGIPVGAADQRVITAQAIDDLGKIATIKRLTRRGADYIHILGIEVTIRNRIPGLGHAVAVIEIEMFHGMSLCALAQVLILQDNALARGRDFENQVQTVAQNGHIFERNPVQPKPVVAAAVQNRVSAVTGGIDIGIIAAKAHKAVVPGAPVDQIRGQEAIYDVIALGLSRIDKGLKQFRPRPNRAIPKGELLDPVRPHKGNGLIFKEILEDHTILGAFKTHEKRIARAFALKLEIGPAQVIPEHQMIIGRAKQAKAFDIGVMDHIKAVIDTIQIGIATAPRRQQVIPGTAIKGIGADKAIDRVLAIGLGRLQHAFGHILEAKRRAILEGQLLNDRRADIVKLELIVQLRSGGRIEHPDKPVKVQAHTVEMPLKRDLVAVRIALGIQHLDHQIGAFANPAQPYVISPDITDESQVVETALFPIGNLHTVLTLADHVHTVANAIDINVIAQAADHHVIATIPDQHIGIGRTDDDIVGFAWVSHGHGNQEGIPYHPIRENDRRHLHGLLLATKRGIGVPKEMILDRQRASLPLGRKYKVHTFAPRHHIFGRDIAKSQLIALGQVDIVDHVIAEIRPDKIGVRPVAALVNLVTTGQVNIIALVGANHLAGRRVMVDQQGFFDPEGIENRPQVQIDADLLIGGQ